MAARWQMDAREGGNRRQRSLWWQGRARGGWRCGVDGESTRFLPVAGAVMGMMVTGVVLRSLVPPQRLKEDSTVQLLDSPTLLEDAAGHEDAKPVAAAAPGWYSAGGRGEVRGKMEVDSDPDGVGTLLTTRGAGRAGGRWGRTATVLSAHPVHGDSGTGEGEDGGAGRG